MIQVQKSVHFRETHQTETAFAISMHDSVFHSVVKDNKTDLKCDSDVVFFFFEQSNIFF